MQKDNYRNRWSKFYFRSENGISWTSEHLGFKGGRGREKWNQEIWKYIFFLFAICFAKTNFLLEQHIRTKEIKICMFFSFSKNSYFNSLSIKRLCHESLEIFYFFNNHLTNLNILLLISKTNHASFYNKGNFLLKYKIT